MKIGALALLTAGGMALTSATVWSVTDPAQGPGPSPVADRPLTGDPRPDPTGDPTPPVAVDRSVFTVGGTLMMNGRLGHPQLAADKPGQTYLFVDVNTQGAELKSAATPVNLAIVIDQSGSMEGQRLTNAIRAARGMVERLRDGDTVSVVGYDTGTRVLVESTTLSPATRAQVLSRIVPGATGGHTCVSCGIEAGMNMLARRTGAVNRMLLLSDGEANRGVTDMRGLQELAASVRQRGSAISSIGVDVDYNERVMLALARESNGRHHFIEDARNLSRAFDAELQSLVQTVGKQAQLSIQLAPGVIAERVFDRSFTQQGDRLLVPLGTFAIGDHKTVLVQLNTPASGEGEQKIAGVDLVYDDLTSGRQGSCRGELFARVSSEGRSRELDPVVEGRLTRSETVAALREANDLFRKGEEAKAQERLRSQLSNVQKRRKKAASRKPPGWSGPDPFDGIEGSLEQASGGFQKNKAQDRGGRAQVRDNAAEMDELSL